MGSTGKWPRRRAAEVADNPPARVLSAVRLSDSTSKISVADSHSFSASGITAQHVRVDAQADYTFDWKGRTHYVALHDMKVSECETFTDDCPVDRRHDLRGRLTYIPAGCRVWGWSFPARTPQSFTALYLDPAHLEPEFSKRLSRNAQRSHLYFMNPGLRTTLAKLRDALSRNVEDRLYLETLCALGALELSHLDAHPLRGRIAGGLNPVVERRITDYIESNLAGNVGLEELAQLAGLSRFHFLRAFKRTTHETPYKFLLRRRIERAQELLRHTEQSIAEIAVAVGFKDSTRFIAAFRNRTSLTPGAFREAR